MHINGSTPRIRDAFFEHVAHVATSDDRGFHGNRSWCLVHGMQKQIHQAVFRLL